MRGCHGSCRAAAMAASAGRAAVAPGHGSSTATVLPPSRVGRILSRPPHSAVSQRMMTRPRPLSCWTAAGSRLGEPGMTVRHPDVHPLVADQDDVHREGGRLAEGVLHRVGRQLGDDQPHGVAEFGVRWQPHSASAPATWARAAETEAGSLGRVTDASRWSAMATSSLSHGTAVRHGAAGSSTVPHWCFAARVPSPQGAARRSTKICIYLSLKAVNSATGDRIRAARTE